MADPVPSHAGTGLSKPGAARMLEQGLFASRWLMAPFYVGMVGALLAVLFVFCRELVHAATQLLDLDAEKAILLALSLIDLSLTANLLLIVMLSGYESFVSKIDTGGERPAWMGTVDFAGLKMKLIASIVAISAIALLRAFLPLAEPLVTGEAAHTPVDGARLGWLIGLHLTFVTSGLVLAVMDWIASKTPKHTGAND